MSPESRPEPRCPRPPAVTVAVTVAGLRGVVASVAAAIADRGRGRRTQTTPLAGAGA